MLWMVRPLSRWVIRPHHPKHCESKSCIICPQLSRKLGLERVAEPNAERKAADLGCFPDDVLFMGVEVQPLVGVLPKCSSFRGHAGSGRVFAGTRRCRRSAAISIGGRSR